MSTASVSTPLPPREESASRTRGGSRAARSCRHCGAPLTDARMIETGFCCAGCSYVFRLVHEHGLDSYYQIKDAVTAPADAAVFQPRDFSWLEQAQREAEVAAAGPSGPASSSAVRIPELVLAIQGISCAGCVWLIERIFQQQPGARDIEANAQLGQMHIRWFAGSFVAADFARKLQTFGYLLGPAGNDDAPLESRALLKRVGLCAAFAMNVMLYALPAYFGMARSDRYADLFSLLALAFGTLSFLVGGIYFIGRAVRALREGALHIDLPIAVGILGAYAGSLYGWLAGEERFIYFDFVATFILLMLVGRWAQVAAVERNQRRLLRQHPKPPRIRLQAGGEIPPEQLRTGQAYLLRSGQTVPVESRIGDADGVFSLASITGEPEPRTFRTAQRIPAGAVSLGRAEVALTALQPWDDSLLAQLLRPAARAGARHLFLEKIIRGYLIGILVVAVGAGLAWWVASHDALRTWSVVTAVLVVSCPCAIGLAFPLADEIATVALRRRGVFVRSDDLWAKLGRVRQLVFDKTGTLTLETPVLLNADALRHLAPEAHGALHRLVADNPHPLSQCLLENLLGSADGPLAFTDDSAAVVTETIGIGVELVINGHRWSLGRPGWGGSGPVGEVHASVLKNAAAVAKVELSEPGRNGSDVELTRDGQVVACFRFADTARPDAAVELAWFQARGLPAFVLSGDRRPKVLALAREVGLPDGRAHGELTPQEKATWIDAHDAERTLMLGDGANDSLAFDRAGCRGTPVIHRGILEQKADFYYLGRGIAGLRSLFEVNGLRRRTQRVILVFSVLYNLLAVGMAVAGHMNPLVAAIMMPANSLITLALVVGGMRAAFAR